MMTLVFVASLGLMNAQTEKRQVVEEGGTGPFKSEVVGDASCPGFTVYRPQNLKEIVAKQGTLPVIVYANGACFNHNVEMRLLLSEVASYGYVAAAIGPYDEADVMAQWRGVLKAAYPETKGDVIMANGEKILPLTPEEKKAREEQEAKQREQAAKNRLVDGTECHSRLRVLSLSESRQGGCYGTVMRWCSGAGCGLRPSHQDLRDAEYGYRRYGDDGCHERVPEEPPHPDVLYDRRSC